ncbi:MAG TPA: ABC transporter permease [Terriglobia bacterium]|nr:ABC transporter permease [Terriglobia bacterium]
MGTLLTDLRYGLRMLARNPGFTAVAVLTLALGIGANTAIFTLIDAVMLRSLPVRDPDRLVVMRWTAHQTPNRNETSGFGDCPNVSGTGKEYDCAFPYPFFELIRSAKEVFSAATAFAGPAELVLSGNGAPRMADGELVSGDYFSTLGVNALAGRALGPDDDSLSAAPAAVLSYAFWQSAFAGDRSVLGRTIRLNGVPFTIVGVTEPGFTSLTPGHSQDFFLTLSMLPRLNIDWGNDSRSVNNWWLVIAARLKAGTPLQRAQAVASGLFRDEMLHGEKPLSKPSDEPAIVLTPAQSGLSGERGFFSKPLYVLMSTVAFILLIACTNVAGLLLSRATARQKEMAVRLALGAGRGRIIRQLLTESLTVSLLGGALGVLLALWGVHALTTLMALSAESPFPFVIEPDWRVLAFTIAISLLTGILFGLAPAWRGARLDLTPALKEAAGLLPGAETHGGRRAPLGKVLVVVQVGLSMIVLIGAGLLVRTLRNLHNVNPGFDTRNVLLFGINPTLEKYSDSQIQSLYRTLQEQLGALPGVISVSYSSGALLSGGLWTSDVHVQGRPEKTTEEVDMLGAGPDFLKTMRIPLLAGRAFSAVDFEQAAHASQPGKAPQQPASPTDAAAPAEKSKTAAGPAIPVLVNAAFARHYFGHQNPLDKTITKGSSDSATNSFGERPKTPHWEIVGVVGDTKNSTLRREIQPMVYVPLTGGGAYFEIRTASTPSGFVTAVRDIAKSVDSNLPLFSVRTQSETIEGLLTQERLIARLAAFFGLLALLLSCIGLYGLLSYEVARRTREIGIRMALGAERRDVLRQVAAQGGRVTIIGLAAGLVGGLLLARLLSSMLYGIRPSDPATLVVVSVVLAVCAVLACYVPARRATKVDPMVALRYE